jgi:hypothetical protein
MSAPSSAARSSYVAIIILGVLHHIDHVLRWDHSGWPFRSDVSPFTFSLLVYPILIPLFFRGVSTTYRIVALTVVFLFVQTAHIFLETPGDQFHTWADGVSHFKRSYGMPNVLHVQSPPLGAVAVAISLLLSVAILVALMITIRDARRYRAWSRSTSTRRRIFPDGERGI